MSDSDQRDSGSGKSRPHYSSNDETRTYIGGSSSGRLSDHHPRQIGKYLLKRVIASGGMGTVFEALQENPRRPVALKVCKSALADEDSVLRLEYEAQLLARLRHPGIAQIYEAGSYEENGSQVPFFAMEYIPNARSITEFAAEKHLNTRQRLELFLQVCDAVHHGHQRGIVHRDLKPSNILVDSAGRVRIIDFGLARATDADMYQAAAHSEHGQIIGSVQYMSPEQFDADPHDIDTRSDVYALGLVLYELLSATLPYNVDSDRILDFATEVREGRTIPLGQRDKSLRGELEAIVQKALEKNRENRYQSAYGLEQDIRRYLAGDVIIARRPGISYQFRVFARRHKSLIALAGTLFVLLLAGVAITTSLLLKVDEERQRAEIASRKSSAGLQFLTEVLASAFPPGFGRDASAIDFLDRASQRLSTAFPNEPEIEADLRRSLGKAYQNVGQWQKSERELDASLELFHTFLDSSDEKILELRYDLASLYNILDYDTKRLTNARAIYSAFQKRGNDSDLGVLEAKTDLADALEEYGSYGEAERLLEEAWAGFKQYLGVDSARTLSVQTGYAWLLMESKQFEAARRIAGDAMIRAGRTYGSNSGSFKNARSCLSGIYLTQGQVDSAMALYDRHVVPERFGIERSFQGTFDLNDKPFQLLVFFATWCPYSHQAMLKLERIDRQYSPFGLNIMGLVEKWGYSSDDDLESYLSNNEIGFAACQEDGRAWSFFDAGGTPAIRLLCNNQLVWETGGTGSLKYLPDMLEGALASRTDEIASP
jgi:serine/threonine protein kinase